MDLPIPGKMNGTEQKLFKLGAKTRILVLLYDYIYSSLMKMNVGYHFLSDVLFFLITCLHRGRPN